MALESTAFWALMVLERSADFFDKVATDSLALSSAFFSAGTGAAGAAFLVVVVTTLVVVVAVGVVTVGVAASTGVGATNIIQAKTEVATAAVTCGGTTSRDAGAASLSCGGSAQRAAEGVDCVLIFWDGANADVDPTTAKRQRDENFIMDPSMVEGGV